MTTKNDNNRQRQAANHDFVAWAMKPKCCNLGAGNAPKHMTHPNQVNALQIPGGIPKL